MKKAILSILISFLIILPFGNVFAQGTNYRYTGQENDPSSNLYYYGQRYYDPNVGRFTQPDPVSKYLNDPQKLNKATGQDLQKFLENPQKLNDYSYTINNPVKYVDPNGETIRQVITGEQSFSDYQVDVGAGGEILYNEGGTWQRVMDNPVLTGLIVGIGVPLTATGIGSLITRGLVGLGLMSAPIVNSSFNVAKEFDKLNKTAQGAYEIALKGGENSGLIKNTQKLGQTAKQLQSGINSLEARVMEHLNYIKDPSTYKNYQQFLNQSKQEQFNTKEFWYNEAINYVKQAEVLKGILNNK